MEPVDNLPRSWEESDFVEEIVSDLESLEGVSGVEWIQQSPYSLYQDLIRIETWQGDVFRLGIGWVADEEIEGGFDEAFTHYLMEKSFEEVGCSCRIQRQRLKELEVRLDAEVLRFRSSLAESPLGVEIADLKQTIAEIDRIEHPALDALAKDAFPYLDQWIAEQEDSKTEELENRELIFQYAQAWRACWRPGARN